MLFLDERQMFLCWFRPFFCRASRVLQLLASWINVTNFIGLWCGNRTTNNTSECLSVLLEIHWVLLTRSVSLCLPLPLSGFHFASDASHEVRSAFFSNRPTLPGLSCGTLSAAWLISRAVIHFLLSAYTSTFSKLISGWGHIRPASIQHGPDHSNHIDWVFCWFILYETSDQLRRNVISVIFFNQSEIFKQTLWLQWHHFCIMAISFLSKNLKMAFHVVYCLRIGIVAFKCLSLYLCLLSYLDKHPKKTPLVHILVGVATGFKQ